MKRILLTSLEFGQSYEVDRAICDLIIAGRLSAVGCVVTGDMWSREFYQLRDVVSWADHETKVGLNLNLVKGAHPLSYLAHDIWGENFPSKLAYALRAPLGWVREDALEAEIVQQLTVFQEVYLRPPHFIAVNGNLLKHRVVTAALLRILKAWEGPRPAIVCPVAPESTTLKFTRKVRKAGFEIIVAGPSVPLVPEDSDIRDFFWHGINEAEDQAMIFCSPSYKEKVKRSRREERLKASRENQFKFLISEEFPFLLMEKDIFLF